MKQLRIKRRQWSDHHVTRSDGLISDAASFRLDPQIPQAFFNLREHKLLVLAMIFAILVDTTSLTRRSLPVLK
jgi:hypothetical protein